MKLSDNRIPEEQIQEVFNLAARLYAQETQSYSVEELIAAGTEAKIPPEFIQQAFEQMQLEKIPNQQPMVKTNRSKPLLIGLAIAIPTLAALAVAGSLLSRNATSNAAINQPAQTAEVEPVTPVSNQTQVANTNVAGNPFKCEGINLEERNLRNENFINADCHQGKLAGVNLSGVNMGNANLSGADLRDANLSGANLKNTNLTEADLTGANLRGTILENANLSKTNLQDANLSNATFKDTNFAEADLEGAKIDIVGAKKNRTNFSNSTLPDGTRHP
ncbi:pentapeptide repeat-containing protein [Limnofasciculus baicalensis]|uniref:Pentapeptide repeat-containing protein n=1 Tax=Limnofasciculus baicalensis BBK-W-15 TaxID=2699891 RepID=A0AAE3KRR5_9CYAN|nr:pentapeptide repeat-containing protein [Limnofasciculus baicalensis]MCP2728717.1 pentapeptide repeat-containing protein [Limnofasciculus baicalensis BBK-W-15]